MDGYKYSGPVDCTKKFDALHLKGKTAIVTGGANGIGEAYARALAAAGLNVCIGDMDVNGGTKLATELGQTAKFVKCDVSKWEDQLSLFKTAATFTGKIDYVVANAGICAPDEVYHFAGIDSEPTEPNLKTIDVNLKGALYTSKLATHYFINQNGETASPSQEDTCLVLIGSGAAFLDCLRGPVYPSTKWAVRGIMHGLRRTAYHYGSRVNVISPWYVRTSILSPSAFNRVSDSGVDFAEPEDAGRCLLRILSDREMNGKSLFLAPKKWAPDSGYLDLDIDDYEGFGVRNENGNGSDLLREMQWDQIKTDPPAKGLFLD